MKRVIVNALEWLCAVLDDLPWIQRRDSESWRSLRLVRHSMMGCHPLGLALLSAKLDERWSTEAWGRK